MESVSNIFHEHSPKRGAGNFYPGVYKGLARLSDTYTAGLLTKEEFEPRLGRLRQRIAALEQQAQQEREAAATTHDVQGLVGRLDEIATKVRAGLADADWHLRRESIRALVKQIEVTSERITVVFRIGPQHLGPGPPPKLLPYCLSRLSVDYEQAGPHPPRRPSKHSSPDGRSIHRSPELLLFSKTDCSAPGYDESGWWIRVVPYLVASRFLRVILSISQPISC